MVWTTKDYPSSMKNLEPQMRDKAIEIANALLEEGYEEDHAIPIAIATAKKWAENHNPSDWVRVVHQLHVIPHPNGWAVRRANAEHTSFVFDDRDQAQMKALEMAQDEHGSVVVHDEDGHIKRHIIPT